MMAPSAAPQWILHPRRDPDRAQHLAREMGTPLPVAHALVHRGIDTPQGAQRYLDPAIEDLHDPFLLRDLDRSVRRLRAAIENQEGILVHGDYDVDGITATFLLHAVLAALGARVEYRIPHRTRDGYGLTLPAIEDAKRRGCSVIVTVDCGITAHGPIAAAQLDGVDVIVTDHHEPPAALPGAFAIVNPLQPGCEYPFKSLAGVGVAFKLAEALLRGHGGMARARELLDVVALGTIADVVPLVGENRVLARLGLDRLNQLERPGLRALAGVTGLLDKRISSGHVAFVIAPRINASGRMGNAEQGLRLLLARDSGEALALAESLDEDNDRRRRHDETALTEAAQRVEHELGYPDCCSLVLWSEHWHPGVIGIVASRLVERFQRPALLIALDGDKGRGSGRSLPGLDLNRLLATCADLLDSFGGHAVAAGFTIRRGRLPEFRARIEQRVAETLSPDDCVPRLALDADVALHECNLDLVEWIERMSPHGLDNQEPVFRAPGVQIESASAVAGGKHLRLRVRENGAQAEAIGFGMGGRLDAVRAAGRCDLAFVPTRNEWMGETRVQLKLKGVQVP